MRMRKMGLILSLLFITQMGWSQSLNVVKFDQLRAIIEQPEHKVTVINFWATWCGPCVKELPYFEEISKKEGAAVYLVSLDFPEEVEKVNRFIQKRNLTAPVMILNETDYDSFIREIDSEWSGAIPATLMISDSGKKSFFEQAFTKEQLKEEINRYID